MESLQNLPIPTSEAESHPSDATVPIQLVLEITRGSTEHRRRPVNRSRYLIGAGDACDLRLGGEKMPALHSIIATEGNEITLEAIAAEPALVVNGSQVDSVPLHDGDVITIGGVEILARVETGSTPAGSAPLADTITSDTSSARPLAELSADELVDMIEQEEREIEQFEARQELGMTSLLQAIASRKENVADATESLVPAPHFHLKPKSGMFTRARHMQQQVRSTVQKEVEQIGRQLSRLSEQLRNTSERSAARDAELTQAAVEMLDTQEKLVEQLKAVVDQVELLQAGGSTFKKPRAIA